MRFLEDVLTCKVKLQKELAAKHEKDNAEIQKRIDEARKQTAKSDEEAAGGLRWSTSKIWSVGWWVEELSSFLHLF